MSVKPATPHPTSSLQRRDKLSETNLMFRIHSLGGAGIKGTFSASALATLVPS